MKPRYVFRLLVELAFFCLMIGPAAKAASIGVDVEVVAPTRAKAERQAIEDAINEVLPRYLGDVALNEEVQAFFSRKLDAIAGRNYRPLQKSWRPTVDAKGKSGYLLEGRMRLEAAVLKNWADECTKSKACQRGCDTIRVAARRSIYVIPVDVSEDLSPTEMMTRKRFMHALEQELLKSKFEIKRSGQQNQADFLIQLAESRYDQHAEIRTIGFTVEIKDRADGSLIGTADGTAAGAFLVSTDEVNKRLLRVAAEKTTAEVRRVLTVWDDLKFEFYAANVMNREAVRGRLQEEMLKLFEMPVSKRDEFASAIDMRIFDDGDFSVYSINIPNDYCPPPQNVLKEELRRIGVEVMGLVDIRDTVQNAGRKISLYDQGNCPPLFCQPVPDPWEASVEALVRAGKLDSPTGIGNNAVDTLRHALRQPASNKDAVADAAIRVARIFVDQHRGAIAGTEAHAGRDPEPIHPEQYLLAGRYLDRAEGALRAGGVEDRSFVDEARAALARRVRQQVPETPSSRPANGGAPLLVFPELESQLRGFAAVPREGVVGLAADSDGIKVVTVAGKAVELRPAAAGYGRFIDLPGAKVWQFSLPVSAQGTVVVRAEDGKSEVTERQLRFEGGRASIPVTSDLADGKRVLEQGERWALLIGNQDYTNGWSALVTPHADIEGLKSVLVERYGFPASQVVVVKDATKAAMEAAMYRIHEKVGPNDSLIIYYAGHGYQDPSFGGNGFWIPVDAVSPESSDTPPQQSWLPNSLVYDITKNSRARHVLLISDSCYAGTFRTRGEMRGEYAASLDFVYSLAGKMSRRAITSGDLEPVVDGGGDGRSVFAQKLIEALRSNQDVVSAGQMFKRVRKAVTSAVAQTPQYFELQQSGDDGGDFVFVPSS